jgi:hypothetical protein
MIAAIGGFLGLVVFITIAIIFSLLNKRQDREEAPPVFRPPGQPPPAPPARSWEEELRRALEGTVLERPVIEPPPAPRPSMRRVPPPVPVLESEELSDAGGIEVSLSVPEPNIEPVFRPFTGLDESQQRYAGAAQLQKRVAQHMADLTRHRVGTTTAHHSEVPAETLVAARSLRSHHGARVAIIASIILGPPRALEG